jgi:type I restriction enzyme S subunit
LRSFKVNLPPLTVQRRIAHILGTLDDKIEHNRRMNATLEGMARALFKSWFVDFDPVRAKADGRAPAGMSAELAALFPDSFEDSPLGKVPRGWGVGTVGDLGDIVCGKTPPTRDRENYSEDMPFITIPDMHGSIFVIETAKRLSKAGIKTQPTKTLPAFSVCVSCIATPGLVALTSEPSQTNQQINSVIPTDKYTAFYCYYALRGLAAEIIARGSGGSVVTNLNKGQFSVLPMLIPPEPLTRAFQETVLPLMKKLLSNEQQTRTLAALRDALLPKLLSGAVAVGVEGIITQEDL